MTALSIDGREYRLQKYSGHPEPDYWTLTSPEGKTYTLDVDNNGFWMCDCPSWEYRGHCKHADSLREHLKRENEPMSEEQAKEQTTTLPAVVKPALPATERGIQINSFESLWQFARCVAASGLAPKGMNRPESCVVAIQMGLELGLSPMSALQNIGVINGKPGIYGDAALALVRASGLLEEFEEHFEGEGDKRKAICRSRRRGDKKARETEFSVEDAKTAKLWRREGPWTTYPDRMLMFRARGFNLRDQFPDVLKGFKTVEELRDYPAEPKQIEAMPEPSVPAEEPPPSNRATSQQLFEIDHMIQDLGWTVDYALKWLRQHWKVKEAHDLGRDVADKVIQRLADKLNEARRQEQQAQAEVPASVGDAAE